MKLLCCVKVWPSSFYKDDGKMKEWMTSGLGSDFIDALYLVSEPENMLRVSAKRRPYGSVRDFRGAVQSKAFFVRFAPSDALPMS